MTDDERPAEVPEGAEAGPTSDATGTTGAAGSGQVADPTRTKKRQLPIWQESILLVAIALVLAVVVKALFVQAFYIPSASMEPGLVNNDRIIVEKPSYWFGGSPSRGDVVVFEDPGGWLGSDEGNQVSGFRTVLSKVGLYPSGGHLVKRVVGVAGDTITCCDAEGRIMVNGVPLDEGDYIAPRRADIDCNGPMISTCDWSAGPVPEGSIFVMGDNRSNSADSTVHICLEGETDCTDDPFIDVDLVVGKVVAVVWPARNFHLIGTADSFADVPDAG